MSANNFKPFVFIKYVLCISLVFFTCALCLHGDAVSVTQENDKDIQTTDSEDFGSSKNVLSSADLTKEDLREDYLNPMPLTAMNDDIDEID